MSREPLRIAFFGLPLAALLLRHDGHEIVHASLCRDDAVGVRRLVRLLGARRVSMKPRIDATFVARLQRLEPDLVVSWFWTKRLPPSILKLTKGGAIGVHPSLLPRHRGPDPYFWAIDRGDPVTGVSAHWLETEYDTGAVVGQRALSIAPTWNAWQLARALDRPSLMLLREVVGRIAAGEKLEGIEQDEAVATSAPSPTDEELELDWSSTCAQIVARVRAAAPTPGAFTDLGGREFVIVEAEPRPMTRALSVLAPGELAMVDGEPLIRAADGGVAILAAHLGDGSIEKGKNLLSLLAAFLPEDAPAPM